MSQFLPESMQTDGQIRTPAKGPEAFLSRDEETFLTRILGFPESYPPKFKSWLIEHMAINMQPVPASLVRGGQSTTVVQAQVLTSEATTSITYTNLATVGPSISDLADGNYMIWFGFRSQPPTNTVALMALDVNGTAASDNDAVSIANGATGAADMSSSRAISKTLSNNNNNTITAKYRVSVANSTAFQNRWMVVMRVGN